MLMAIKSYYDHFFYNFQIAKKVWQPIKFNEMEIFMTNRVDEQE